jgi:hypothetical protein
MSQDQRDILQYFRDGCFNRAGAPVSGRVRMLTQGQEMFGRV